MKNHVVTKERGLGFLGTGFAEHISSIWQGLRMKRASTLDLIGDVSPICLLKCKSALARLNPGEVLEVMVRDQEVVESLSMILKQSQDSMEAFFKEGEGYRISIRKGG
jgi:tRNA 2-thiouridine synthesizing protein A